MNAVDVVEIACIAVDGTKVAAVTLTPDMPDEKRIELAPLIQLTPETAQANGETEYQLLENGRYYYDIEKCVDVEDLRLRCHLAHRRRNLRDKEPDAGRIETGNFCGTLLLEIVEGDANDPTKPALASALVDIRSVKLDYRSEYRGMLRNLSGRMADLVVDARSSTKTSFRSNFEERGDKAWFQVQLEFLRDLLDSVEFSAALQRIVTYPHERLEQELEMTPVERPFRWKPKALHDLVNSPIRRVLPAGHPLRDLTSLKTIASRVPDVRKTLTVDTPENRFIKYALFDFHAFLSRAQRVFEEASGDWSSAAGAAQRLALNIEQWLSRQFFKEITALNSMPLGSPVLQRKGGYREVLRWWLRFRTAADLSWEGGEDLFRAGQRNVADLYEYWLFFSLLDWFCARFDRDGERPLVEQLVDGLDGDSPILRLRKRVFLGPFSGMVSDPRRRLHAAFSYNREFKVTTRREIEGSWTRKMHPDYTLTIWPVIDGMTADEACVLADDQELLVHIHLDAKYRVNSLRMLFGATTEDADEEDGKSTGNYKRQDLLKMHAYRDAIKRSEGAYILYPGDETSRLEQYRPSKDGADRWPHTMWGFHEIIPGLGAFAIAPDEHGQALGIEHLSKFLEEILENLSNRASLRERRTSSLYETLRERRSLDDAGDARDLGAPMLSDSPELDADALRLPATPDIMVLVGWFDSDQEKDWIIEKGKAVIRLGDRRGSLPLVKSLAAATHILLHGKNEQVLTGLWRILPETGKVLTRTELLNEGFPTDSNKSSNHIFAVFSVDADKTFANLQWHNDGLHAALKRFLNRQRPANKKQLTKTADRSYPFLVSLADLQEALVTQQ
ncbi:MAG: DUF2357 domain-containing protein [Pyrinomonadaceae bacterium]